MRNVARGLQGADMSVEDIQTARSACPLELYPSLFQSLLVGMYQNDFFAQIGGLKRCICRALEFGQADFVN